MNGQQGFSIPREETQRAMGHARMRAVNMGLVLRHLRDHGGCSRAELAVATGLSKASITNVVGGLLDAGLVEEGDAELAGRLGRPSIEVRLRGDQVVGLGIEITADHLALSAVDFLGRPLEERSIPLSCPVTHWDQVLAQVAATISVALKQWPGKIAGVTLSPPGIIDYAEGVVRFAPAVQWEDVPVVEAFRRHLGCPELPIYLENDAKLSALISYAGFRGTAVKDLVHVTAGPGVGAGIISEGRLVRGWSGFSGELGHTTLNVAGPRCPCGRRGCLELYVGLPAFRRRLAEHGVAVDASLPLGQWLHALQRSQEAGETSLNEVLDQLARDLARGLRPVVDLLNPRVLVLGGYLGFFGDVLVPALDRALEQRQLDAGTHVDVLASDLGLAAAARGGATMALERVFVDPSSVADA